MYTSRFAPAGIEVKDVSATGDEVVMDVGSSTLQNAISISSDVLVLRSLRQLSPRTRSTLSRVSMSAVPKAHTHTHSHKDTRAFADRQGIPKKESYVSVALCLGLRQLKMHRHRQRVMY